MADIGHQDDVEESSIPRYEGEKITCAICEHHFRIGDPVMVARNEDVILCPVSEDMVTRNCHIPWVYENKRGISTTIMLFYGGSK